jgi:hypothetical protein
MFDQVAGWQARVTLLDIDGVHVLLVGVSGGSCWVGSSASQARLFAIVLRRATFSVSRLGSVWLCPDRSEP